MSREDSVADAVRGASANGGSPLLYVLSRALSRPFVSCLTNVVCLVSGWDGRYVRYAYDGHVFEATFDDEHAVNLPSRYAQVMGPVGSVY